VRGPAKRLRNGFSMDFWDSLTASTEDVCLLQTGRDSEDRMGSGGLNAVLGGFGRVCLGGWFLGVWLMGSAKMLRKGFSMGFLEVGALQPGDFRDCEGASVVVWLMVPAKRLRKVFSTGL
jgi:hypothetical protein